ncbi:MAG: hypothetical protein GXY67_10550 [Clostridiales bacterium]|nr:hypothetical protein [Clostridiales bacterium]
MNGREKTAAFCPLTHKRCRLDCSWRMEAECAAVYIGRELYSAVEVLSQAAQRGEGVRMDAEGVRPGSAPACNPGER